ncbi:diphosphomevalonate decarboxylase [Basidiobolus meristosporus CBS 931.73]|uniref:Diphosphomevalonate decarboxylase n=1 Tax=Basidiobolus meristosporus CBS 931.73 TaxID=1314790 RepID=A0A1Y1YMU6_9FUNG|nr:diphosphomevalonate decarboxylase [Basidiobolus meristosporus CBS 931.73]|eukprot:ORX99066.1 diphosphomevalonate decarboxylase [Basidiobolus meristosporus CBS 931.73]
MTTKEVTCTAPVNIAVIKYWGKRDKKLILPTNSSLSATLSQDQLHSKTTIRTDPSFDKDRLWLNGIEEDISKNPRLVNCFAETRRLRQEVESKLQAEGKPVELLSHQKFHVCSENNFPTAAGLASSASGYACLVYTLAQLFELPMSTTELSKIARLGSGSACRSLFGGFVAWEMGTSPDGSDSQAVQVAPQGHWPEIEALICVVSDAKKGVSSTSGMQTTVETSPLLQERLRVVPERMKAMSEAILKRDFPAFAELTMKDSNQFHSVCLDTYPPIFYLNDVSRAIIRIITEYNSGPEGIKAAYTFDAGPNAVIYAPKKNIAEIVQLIAHYFPASNPSEYFKDPYNVLQGTLGQAKPAVEGVLPIFPPGSVKHILHTPVGDGPRILKAEESLLEASGMPKRIKSLL